jgi:hypothetical protein
MAQMSRAEVWQLQYRGNRYMRDLPNDALSTRVGDLMTAMVTYTSDGKFGMKPVEGEFSEMERFAHALEEMAIRGLNHRQVGVLEALNLPNEPKARRALTALAGRSWPEPILVKFGKLQHMAALLLGGKGRVSPASFYADPSLGRARSDNEARIAAYVHPTDAHRFMGVRADGDGASAVDLNVPYLGSTWIELHAKTDFYVYCMAQSCEPRMFADFDEACVVITRPEEFTSRIQNAIAEKLPGWTFIAEPVIYFDPFFARPHQMYAQLCKHFRFSYQREYRLLWLPPSPEQAPADVPWDHVPFEIGPLTAYAKLIRI